MGSSDRVGIAESAGAVKQGRHVETGDAAWAGLYRAGAVAALVAVGAGLLDSAIMFLPGTSVTPATMTAIDWFGYFHNHWLLGLRNLGFLNMVTSTAMVLMFCAVCAAHRRVSAGIAPLAAILLIMGATIYIADNRALPMMALSGQYAAATTDSHRSLLAAAGQAMLAQEDLTPGAFPGFLFMEVGGILLGVAMLRGRIFGPAAAVAGIVGEGSMLLFNVWAAFVPVLFGVAAFFGMCAGLLIMTWLFLTARGLFRLGRSATYTLPLGAMQEAAG